MYSLILTLNGTNAITSTAAVLNMLLLGGLSLVAVSGLLSSCGVCGLLVVVASLVEHSL